MGLEPDVATYVPSDTVALAGVHMDRIPELPKAWVAVLQPLRDATYLLLAFDGKDAVLIARGRFPAAPPGAVLIGPELALAGSPAAVQAAREHHDRVRAAPGLLQKAASVAAQDLWAVLPGDHPLPLPGNWENFNRLLRLTGYTTLTARFDSTVNVDLRGYCRSVEDARELEETVRGIVSLAAATTRAGGLAAILRSVQVDRSDELVHISFSGASSELERLLH